MESLCFSPAKVEDILVDQRMPFSQLTSNRSTVKSLHTKQKKGKLKKRGQPIKMLNRQSMRDSQTSLASYRCSSIKPS